jgi:cytochrome P450
MRNFSLANSRPSRGASQERLFHSIRLAVRLLKYNLTCYILSHPYPLRVVFAVIRRVRPIAVLFGNVVVVTKHCDVREVLDRSGDFNLSDVLGPNMPWGPFLLSLDWRQQHKDERQLLQEVVRPADVDAIKKKATAKCSELIAAKRTVGELDIVSELCNEIMIGIVHRYFGVPIIDDSNQTMRILGDVGAFILVKPPADSERANRAYSGMATLTETLTKKVLDQIAAQGQAVGTLQSQPAQADDLLTRLIKLHCGGGGPGWFNDDWIRRYITGLAATAGGTAVRAAAHAIDRLLAYPAGLQEAQELAAKLQTGGDADAQRRLHQIVYEALRFRPMVPLLVRYSPRETILAKGTDRVRTVPAGGTVIAAAIAGMFDPEVFENPSRFSPNRKLADYLHFGFGPHACFGKYVADIVMVEIIRSLLLLPNLRRAPGSRGKVRHDGAVVTSLWVAFDPATAGAGATSEGTPP